MRIAAVVHNGVKHDARALKGAASLKAQGHDVRLFGLTPDESENFVLPNGVPVYLRHRDLTPIKSRIRDEGLEPGRESSIWISYRIQGDLIFDSVKAAFSPDVVHIHDHLALTAAPKYKEAFGCPLVWDAHEVYEDLASNDETRSSVNSRVIRDNSRYVDGFITLNQSIARYYRERHPELPEAVLIPNAVERAEQSRYDGRLHEKAHLEPDQKILLFQGSFSQHRGIPALLEASRFLGEAWTLVFMGWGALEKEIQKYAEAKSGRPNGRARVAMVPGAPHDELLQWTAGASLGAIPYENAGLNHLYCSPNKLWEYPAAGVPILASDMPEMKKKIEQYGIGVTVDRTLDPKQIAATVNNFTDSDFDYFKRNCVTYAATENWQSYEPRLYNLHHRLALARGIDPGGRKPSSPASSEVSSPISAVWRKLGKVFGRA